VSAAAVLGWISQLRMSPDGPSSVARSGRRYLALSALFAVAFLLLDWATFAPSYAPLGVTPWNPSIGLGLAVVLRLGLGYAPVLAVAPLLSDLLIRDLPLSVGLSLIEALVTGLGYVGAAAILLHSRWRIDTSLETVRDLVTLVVVTTLAALFVAVCYITVLLAFGHLSTGRALTAVMRYWIGDIIGLLVLLPFLLKLSSRIPAFRATTEGLMQSAMVLASVAVVFGASTQLRLPLSYLLFLPIMWIAARGGLIGVTGGLMLMQVAVMTALHLTSDDPGNVFMYQALMVALSICGLTIGVLVDERGRSERYLRLQQDAIARAARIGTLGEVTTSLAHELNQPLTAAGNYARAMLTAVSTGQSGNDAAREAGRKALEQIERSASIISRLRDYISVGRLEVGAHDVSALIAESVELMRPEIGRTGALVETFVPGPLPLLAVDRLQIQQVLTNLIRNAVEALEASQAERPQITISASLILSGFVEIAISDNGIGFPAGFRLARARPVASTKVDGLGIGLSLCQSIVDSHGGRLEIASRSPGATVRLLLPTVGGDLHGR